MVWERNRAVERWKEGQRGAEGEKDMDRGRGGSVVFEFSDFGHNYWMGEVWYEKELWMLTD